MKKKVFSLMMTLLLAFIGVAKAEVVTIGEGTTTTYTTPYNSLWGYSFVEQIYTADEIGTAGTITAISFNLRDTDAAQTNEVEVFMKNVSRTEFSSSTDYETVTASDMVFSGTVTFSPGWTTITLSTPFQYDGSSNLLIGMHEFTPGYSTRYFYYTSAAGMVLSYHSDSANPDPYDLGSYSGNKYVSPNRANIQMDIIPGGGGGGVTETITIGDGATTYYYYPVNMFFNYSLTEQIYTADEIGAAGTISSVAFYYDYTGSFNMDNITMYMKNVSRNAFASNTDMEPLDLGDIVWTGTLAATEAGWITINLDTPFAYNGTDNLLIACFDGTNGYPGSAYKFRTSPCEGYKGINWYSDSYTPDPYNTASGFNGSKSYTQYRNNIQLTLTTNGGGTPGFVDKLHVKYIAGEEEIVDSLNMGVRPVGAWMEPFNFFMFTEGPTYTVTVLDFTPTDGLFSVTGAEPPFQVRNNQDVELTMATNGTEAGVIERQFVALTEGGRSAHLWPLVVELYAPETPDVWELACEEATTFPFVEVPATAHNTTLHNDYTLPFPEIPEGYDAVYKLVIDHDQRLSAEVTYGDNGKVALYTEDFNGEGGPMADNYYMGIEMGGAGVSTPYEVQIGEGTTTSGYLPFYCFYNYSLSQQLFLAAELNEAGVTGAPMTSLSWECTATNNNLQSNITIWIANVEETAVNANSPLTSTMTKVYEGNMTPLVGWNEFVFNQGSFAWDGHSNVLVCVQRNNGAWASGVSWAVSAQSFNAGAYKYSDTEGPYDMTTNSYSMTTTTNRANVIMKGGGTREDNRDIVVTFEDQQIPADWNNDATYPWTVVSESGSYRMKSGNGGVASSTSTITATYDIPSGGTISFDALCMGEGTTTIWDKCIFSLDGAQQFSYGANVSGWNTYTYNLSPGTHTFSWSYSKDGSVNPTGDYFMVDNISITGMGEPLPEPELGYTYGPVIENLPLRAGTYYLVASSTDPDFEVTINAEDMPCPEVEGYAFNPSPADDSEGIEPSHVTLHWNIPPYATGWRLIFGTTYYPEPGHPETIMFPEDGSFTPALANSFTVRNLLNNNNYFWRIEFNNDNCPEGVSSPVWGFTTHLNVPQNLTVVDNTVFNDETIVLNWTPVVDRTYRYYNVYRDGELIGNTQVNNISNSTYTDGPLAYNIDGYTYYVTAVYDEGESDASNTVNVKVSGYGDVDGHVYEQDGTTGIAGATVTMVGHDEFNASHTYNFTTNAQGYYSGHIYAGTYNGSAAKDGYQTAYEPVQGNPIELVYNETTSPVDYIMDENFDPVCAVFAQYYPDSTDINAPYVKVFWGCGLPGSEIIEPFETGDFSMFDWQVDPTYPWTVTTTDPYEGTYCMKSGGAGVANVVSNMTVTVEIPADGLMSFFGKISCESNWDYGYFYIDGNQMGSYTGASTWSEKTFDITAGEHTFQWRYTKDGSVNSNDDCFYVDYITFYKQPEPAIPGMTYDFDNSTMQGWTSVDADGDGYGWYVASEIMSTGYGHNGSNDCVLSQSYNNSVGVLYPDNYLVSPQVQLGGLLRFYACAQDASYAAEHFGVAVSTTNTQPSSFTMLQEWTMSAKSSDGGKPVKEGTRSGRAQGNWYEYTVDLSAYSGMGYVAIRHFNCSDMFYLDVDDITIGEPGKGMSSNNRAFAYYRIYRTDCYNDGPYTEENTVLLASEVTDTVYIDTYWPDVAPGVYKWGVGCVYMGNRGELIEGPISWAEPMAINPTVDKAPNAGSAPVNKGNRAPWDLMMTFTAPEAGHYGVAYDGNNFYTSNWGYGSAAHNFYKYDLSGNMLEGFEIPGCGTLRGITYDGTNFYGVANSNTVYCVDLANHSVVSTFTSAYGAMRGITYDPERDGFWVIGNWSGNLTLIDRTGAIVQVGPEPASASDLAYYKDENDVEHVFCFNNADNGVYDYNITTNTLGGSVFNFSNVPGFDAGSTGGCTVGNFNGKMAFIGDIQQDPNLIGIYELREGGSVGPTPPTPGTNNPIQEPRESEIVWSNCLDKDMYLDHVSVNVLLNSADSPEGTTVDFTNLNEYEQQTYPIAQVVLDETGYYEFDSFRRGDYLVQVRHEGYEPIDDTVSIWENTDLRYVMIEILYGVENVYVSRTGWAMWEDSHNNPGGPGGGGQGGSGSTFSENFDAGMPAGWTTVDADGDGYTWVSSMTPGNYHNAGVDLTGTGHNASAHYVISGSWANGTGQVLYPDNYLVSPQVTLAAGSTFSFWACAQDASYPADHFGVAISDNGTSDWTMVQEWTMTAKGTGAMSYGRDGNNRVQGNWYQYIVDLSAYAGQKYIAIRHFNCSDQFILNVDDIELTAGAKAGDRHFEYYKLLCTSIDGVPIFNHNTVHPFCQLSTDEPFHAPLVEGDHYLFKVAAVYSTGQSEWSTPVEWQYEPCDHWGPVDEVTVSPNNQGNHIEWVFDHGYNPYGGDVPGPGPGGAGSFQVDFEGGMPEGWTVIDANNDGWTWCMTSNIPSTWTYYAGMTLDWYHNGTNAICSGSYINGVGALNPDEYLVSPLVNIAAGSQLSFWVAATDASYAADHFGVCVSDDGTSNWAMVQEWTLTGKKQGMMGGAASRDGEGLRLGTWYNYTVDLSAYAGQKHIAFRHFNCYDQYIMCLDDIELTAGAKGGLTFNKGGEFYTQYAEDGVMLNFLALDNVNLRVYMLYVLSNDSRFSLVPEQEYGQFVLTSTTEGDFMNEFEAVYSNAVADFNLLTKVDIDERINHWKNAVSSVNLTSVMMDVLMSNARPDNDHCINSLPFCTSEEITFEAASTSNTANEPGMDDGCIGSSYNPSFYHMRIHTAGPFVIHMEGHDPNNGTDRDIDFCMWGPYTEQEVTSGTACSNLTGDKIMDCCYSASYSENCYLGYPDGQHQHNTSHGTINYHEPQVGEYYILMITNFSQQPCVISFTKTEGEGETDCDIVTNPDVLGFLITQDGEYLAFAGPDDREYFDIDEFGEHEYCVRPIYPGEMVLPEHNYGWSMGCPVCEFGPTGQAVCNPGAPIHAEQVNGAEIKVWWGNEPAAPIEEWLYYDDGANVDAIGLTSGGSFYWGIKFPAASLSLYEGCSVTKIAYFDYAAHTGNVLIYSGSNGNAPGNLIGTYNYTANGTEDWAEWNIPAVAFDNTQDLWIVMNNNGGQYVAALGNYTGDPNGTMISTDGVEWYTLSDATGGQLTGTWNLRCYVSNQAKGGEVAVLDNNGKGTPNGVIAHSGVAKHGSFPMTQTRASIVMYNVYRSTEAAGTYTMIGQVPEDGSGYYYYIDAPEAAGTYYYQVRALYNDDCESEPAQAADDPTHNYVTGTCDGLNENSDNVALYPNPTNGNVTIEASGIRRITVVSVLGQMVYDKELNADNYTLNMGQFNAGIYMVRVYTENGMTVKRVTVMQ